MPPVKKSEVPAEVQIMSNSELAAQLRARGVDVGPIIATTRKVYERKLGELLLTGGPEPQASASEDEAEEQIYDEEISTQEEPEVVPFRFSTTAIRPRPRIREDLLERDSLSYTTSHIYTNYGDRQTGVAARFPSPPPKKGMSIIVKLLLFLILMALVYLVVVNMEGTQPKPQALTEEAEGAGQSPS